MSRREVPMDNDDALAVIAEAEAVVAAAWGWLG